jgi:Flp pilus assembly protein TadG
VKTASLATIISASRVGNHPPKLGILAMTSSPAKTANQIPGAQQKSSRKGERGVTIVIAAVAMVSLLAMLVLAIDVVTLYVASGQAQQAADAAALALRLKIRK